MPSPNALLPRVALAIAAAAALAAGTAGAHPLPASVVQAEQDLRRVGGGELRWLGRPVYHASLWTADGRFDGFEPGQPVALSLWYQRSFSRDELLRITATAWRLLGDVPKPQREAWIDALARVWSDVASGDNLTTVVVPGGATRFYDDDRFLGQLDDPRFGPAFLSIWLDSRSVLPDLRVRLLGADSTVANR